MCLPVCGAGFLGFLRFQPVAGGLGLGVGKYLPLQLLFPLQLRFQCFQLAAGLAHFLIGGINGGFQLLRGSEAVFLIHIQRRGHLFEVVHGRPAFITPAFALGHFLLNVHKPLHTVLFRGGLRGFCGLYAGFPTPGVFEYGRGLFCGSGGVLLQNGKDSGAVKVVTQLPGGNGLCPVRRKVGKPPPALLDGHALPQQQRGKVLE